MSSCSPATPPALARRATSGAGGAADDIEVARAAGLDVAIVAREDASLRTTPPGNCARAEQMLESAMDVRRETGFDAHRCGAGNRVTPCGVEIVQSGGLNGHSNAHVAMRALTNAIPELEAGHVGLRATTPKRRGFAGREAGIAAMANTTLLCDPETDTAKRETA